MNKYRLSVLVMLLALICGFSSIATASQTIAVLPFETAGGVDSWWWGMEEMLDGTAQLITDRLANDPDLVVVDRTRIEDILMEQDFQESGAVDPTTASQIGRLIGADLMVVGTLNEFGFKNEGGISVSVFSISQANASVRLSARIIAVETGQVLASCEGSGKDSGTSLSVDDFEGVSFASSEFEGSVVGKAYFKALDDLMSKFKPALQKAESRTSTQAAVSKGKVVALSGNFIILDVGSANGVTERTVFDVYHLQSVAGLSTPVRIPAGTLKVVSVDPNATVTTLARQVEGAPQIQVGDQVEYALTR